MRGRKDHILLKAAGKILSEICDIVLLIPSKAILFLGGILALLRVVFPPVYFELSTTTSRSFFGFHRQDVRDRVYIEGSAFVNYYKQKLLGGRASIPDENLLYLVSKEEMHTNYSLAIFYGVEIMVLAVVVYMVHEFIYRKRYMPDEM